MIKDWIENRLKQRSTVDGIIMVVGGAGIIIFSGLAQAIAYAAIAYGAYTIWRN
jgi:hypothetical protein